MNPQIKKHFVITVHYGDPAPTIRAVNSLLQNSHPPDHIVVVNHGQALPLKSHPLLIVIHPPQNAGYAAGINMGLGVITTMDAKPHDIVTCLNNDAVMSNHTFKKLRRWWDDHPENILLGLTVYQENQNPQQSGQVNLFTGRSRLTNQALPAPRLHNFFTLSYVHGAGFSAPLHLLLTNHGLPAQYFMYWEDVLFSRQLTRRRIPLITTNAITINHDNEVVTSPARDKKLYYLVRNGAMFLECETPILWRPYWWVLNRLRYVYHHWRGRQPVVIQALKDAINHTTGAVVNI